MKSPSILARREFLQGVLTTVAAFVSAHGCSVSSSAKNRLIAAVPFETSLGVPFVPVSINATGPYRFLLDTGGGGSLIERAIADRLNLDRLTGRASVSGNSSLQVGIVPNATIALGTARVESQLTVTSFGILEQIFGRPLDGILGGSFMMQFVVELDFDKRQMRLFETSTYQHNDAGQQVSLEMVDNIPYVELKVTMPNGKSVAGRFLVDTGGGGMVVHVHKQVADREKLTEGLTSLGEVGQGIGGQTSRRAVRGQELLFGKYRLERPAVVITEDTAGLRSNAASIGLVGVEVLSRFRLVFDYSRKLLYLSPNRTLHAPFVYDTSGLRLRASSPNYAPPFVSGVRDASPAFAAGIKVGDVLKEIDGIDSSKLKLDEAKNRLKQPGKKHRLSLLRDGTTLNVELVTREMLN
jgi:predicted aspartyl protease